MSEFVKKAVTAFLWLTSIEFSFLRSKMKCRSHKIDNSNKLSLKESVTHPFRPSSISARFFQEKNLSISYLYSEEVPPSTLPLNLICIEALWSSCVFRVPCSLPLPVWLLPWFIVQSMHRIRSSFCKEIRKKNLFRQFYSCHLLRYFSHYK